MKLLDLCDCPEVAQPLPSKSVSVTTPFAHKHQEHNSNGLHRTRDLFGAHKWKVRRYSRMQKLNRVIKTHLLTLSLSALLAFWWALSSDRCPPGGGPWQHPTHTVPHIMSPSPVSNKNQRALIRGWEIDTDQSKTTHAHHRTLMWKCTAWAED